MWTIGASICIILIATLAYSKYIDFTWKRNLNPDLENFNFFTEHLNSVFKQREEALSLLFELISLDDPKEQHHKLTRVAYPTYSAFILDFLTFVPVTPKVKELYDTAIDFILFENKALITLALAFEAPTTEQFNDYAKRGWDYYDAGRAPYTRWNNLVNIVRNEINKAGFRVTYTPMFTPAETIEIPRVQRKSYVEAMQRFFELNFEVEEFYLVFLQTHIHEKYTARLGDLNTLIEMNLKAIEAAEEMRVQLPQTTKVADSMIDCLRSRERFYNLYLDPNKRFRDILWEVDELLFEGKKYEREWIMQFEIWKRDCKYLGIKWGF